MSTSTFEKVKEWLSPLVAGLATLVAIATVTLNEGRDRTAEQIHADFDKRITIVENQTGEISVLTKQLSDLNIRLTELVVKMELLHTTTAK